jgi:hypothetical protein
MERNRQARDPLVHGICARPALLQAGETASHDSCLFAAQLGSVGYKKRLDAPLLHWALAALADGDMITTIASMAATVPMILRTGFPPGGRGSRAEVFAAHGCSGLDAGT